MEKTKKNDQKPVAITIQDEKIRLDLVKQFIESVILFQYRQLVDWQTVTGQSSQLDSGYLAQQLVSLLTGISGTGQRGKGLDLSDGSDVKAASTLSGVDVPRWNNPIGELRKRLEYLNRPSIFFVLFDTTKRGQNFPLRVRVWRIQPQKDDVFRQVVNKWAKTSSSGNFQLHPPCWRDDNVATNRAGKLELPLMFHALQRRIGSIDYMDIIYINFSPGLCKLVA